MASPFPFSVAKVSIYRRIYQSWCKDDAWYTASTMFDILHDEKEDISRRCAAVLVIWHDVPDPFNNDADALYSFCEDVAQVCWKARRSTCRALALDEIARIDEIRHQAREVASMWREEAEAYAREFHPYAHYSAVCL